MKTPIFVQAAAAATGLLMTLPLFVAGQQGNAGKTAGEQYKNIQVMKDVPAAQFIPGMRVLATELGVECEFCHEGNRSVDTPNKQTARKMYVMMQAINKANFDGRQEVTCYTCHKGQHDPGNVAPATGQYSTTGPTFYRPIAPPVGATDEPMFEAYKEQQKEEQAEQAKAPKAEDILANYVKALGGEEALKKVTSRVITSTTELSPNVRGAGPMIYVQQVQYFKAPNLYMMTQKGFDGSQTAKGFDGTAAWSQNARGVVTQASGTDLARAKRSADLYEPINLKQAYTRLIARGEDKVGDREAYVVIGVPQGENPERLYFDKETGLLLRKVISDTTAVGRYSFQTDYEDYRDAGGVKVPFLIRTLSISPADTMVVHVEKVDTNPAIDAAKFTKPESKPPAAR